MPQAPSWGPTEQRRASLPETAQGLPAVGAESSMELLTQAAFQRGTWAADQLFPPAIEAHWPAPGSLLVKHFDHHPSCQPLKEYFLSRSRVRDPRAPSSSLDEASHPTSRAQGNKVEIWSD